MNKIKKIFIFISLFLILSLSFTGSVYAERNHNEEETKPQYTEETDPTDTKPEVVDEKDDKGDKDGDGWWVDDVIQDIKDSVKEKYEEFKEAVADVVENNQAGGVVISKSTKKFKCKDVKYLTWTWTLIRILAPFIIILFGSLDFFKSMVAGDEKAMKTARGKFVKRMIAFVLLIFLPFVVQFIFNNIGTYGSENTCLVKCIVTNDTSSKGCD